MKSTSPQSPSRGRALPTKPASSQWLPLRLSISHATSLLVPCTCDSPSCHRAFLSLEPSHNMSSLHLVNSNSLLRSRLKHHLFRKSLLGPPVQLWTVTNSVVTNSQFSSLRCAYTFICVALCSQLTLLFQVHDGMGVVCLGSQIYPQHLIVSGSEQMHNKCLMNE